MVGSGPMTWEGIAKGSVADLIRQSWKSELHLEQNEILFGSGQRQMGKICSDRAGAILSALLLTIITGT